MVENSINIGNFAGTTNQGSKSINIGNFAGSDSQGSSSISIGDQYISAVDPYQISQGNNSISLTLKLNVLTIAASSEYCATLIDNVLGTGISITTGNLTSTEVSNDVLYQLSIEAIFALGLKLTYLWII